MTNRERSRLVIDDRLLIEELLVGLHLTGELWSTPLWYYRACRAAMLGASGHLSGPFEQLPEELHAAAVRSLLDLPEWVQLADPRVVVPRMAEISGRHPHLNLLNLEAVATGVVLGASMLLSPPAVSGVLPAVLGAEGVSWNEMTPRET